MIRKYHKYVDRMTGTMLIFVLPAIVVFILYRKQLIPQSINGISVSGTMLGVWGSMLGFMITALSIIVSLGDGVFITTIRETSHFKTILLIFIQTCIMLFSATAFSAIVVCFNYWRNFCQIVLVYFLVGTIAAIFWSMVFLFYMVINACNYK